MGLITVTVPAVCTENSGGLVLLNVWCLVQNGKGWYELFGVDLGRKETWNLIVVIAVDG